MEVHHHPKVENKNFKEYFLEFLMIFLAVTLGFFAESLREHINDRAREKEYVASFVDGLKQDTAQIKELIILDSLKDKGMDSVLDLSGANFRDTNNQRLLFYYDLKYLNNISLFKGSDVVMQQLRNSGGMRLIQKDHAADSIVKYDESVKNTYGQGDIYKNLFNDIINCQFEIFDFGPLNKNPPADISFFMKIPHPFVDNDKKKLKIFFNKVYAYKSVNKYYYKALLVPHLHLAERMITFLHKEYDF